MFLFPVLRNDKQFEEHRSEHQDIENKTVGRIVNLGNITLYNDRIAALNVFLFPVLRNGEQFEDRFEDLFETYLKTYLKIYLKTDRSIKILKTGQQEESKINGTSLYIITE